MRTGKPGLAGSCYALWSKICHVIDVIDVICCLIVKESRLGRRYFGRARRHFACNNLLYLLLRYGFHPGYEWMDSTYSYLFSWRDFTAHIKIVFPFRSSSPSIPWKPSRRGQDCLLSSFNNLLGCWGWGIQVFFMLAQSDTERRFLRHWKYQKGLEEEKQERLYLPNLTFLIETLSLKTRITWHTFDHNA
jgi:hypothetical protein